MSQDERKRSARGFHSTAERAGARAERKRPREIILEEMAVHARACRGGVGRQPKAAAQSSNSYFDVDIKEIARVSDVSAAKLQHALSGLYYAAYNFRREALDGQNDPSGNVRRPQPGIFNSRDLLKKLRDVLSISMQLSNELGIDKGKNEPGYQDWLYYSLSLSLDEGADELFRFYEALSSFQRAVDRAIAGSLPSKKRGRPNDDPLNDWIRSVLGIYQYVARRRPASTIYGTRVAGISGGPTIRFLQLVGAPLGIVKSPAAWSQHVKQWLAWRYHKDTIEVVGRPET